MIRSRSTAKKKPFLARIEQYPPFRAASLDMDVLAEFVETQVQMEALHDLGCDLYQGYL